MVSSIWTLVRVLQIGIFGVIGAVFRLLVGALATGGLVSYRVLVVVYVVTAVHVIELVETVKETL